MESCQQKIISHLGFLPQFSSPLSPQKGWKVKQKVFKLFCCAYLLMSCCIFAAGVSGVLITPLAASNFTGVGAQRKQSQLLLWFILRHKHWAHLSPLTGSCVSCTLATANTVESSLFLPVWDTQVERWHCYVNLSCVWCGCTSITFSSNDEKYWGGTMTYRWSESNLWLFLFFKVTFYMGQQKLVSRICAVHPKYFIH